MSKLKAYNYLFISLECVITIYWRGMTVNYLSLLRKHHVYEYYCHSHALEFVVHSLLLSVLSTVAHRCFPRHLRICSCKYRFLLYEIVKVSAVHTSLSPSFWTQVMLIQNTENISITHTHTPYMSVCM